MTETNAHVIAAAFDPTGRVAAFALADGALLLQGPTEERHIPAHTGGILAMLPDEAGFLTAGDDGRLRRTTPAGETTTLGDFKGRWVESLAVFGRGREARIACGVGKRAHVLRGDGEALRVLEHPSTATGLAFDAKGKRLAVSHYGGVSLWFLNSEASPRLLEWKGSHTGVALHPAGEAVVSAMQEPALHGWRLPDGAHMRMSGYPAKTETLSFTSNGRWLATSGADAVVLWPFFGGGPMGKPPLELAARPEVICARVAAHPKRELVAAGFADGTVLLAGIADGATRELAAADPAAGRVSALAWSADGSRLAWGTETGRTALAEL